MNRNSTTFRLLRATAAALAIWVAFFWLQSAMSVAVASRAPDSRTAIVETDLVLAVLWALLSVGIASWHRYARSIGPNLLALATLHLPVLAFAIWIDIVVSRWSWIHILNVKELLPFAASVVSYADFDVVAYVAVVAVAEAVLMRDALLERQRLAERLEASLSRARLDYLEAQLQPHFLFNSLGAVSELAYDAPATASRVLRQLTAIFRAALAKKGDEVTLGEEIVGIEPYLDIQRIRFADWLAIEYQVDDSAVDCLLPRFILQPLLENAIRHGLSGRSIRGTIIISASVESGSLLVRVVDNGVGLDAATPSGGHGIGLSNVRDRLAILYGDDDRLNLMSNASGGTVAELRVPARQRDSQNETRPVEEGATPGLVDGADFLSLELPTFLRRPWLAISATWLVCGLLWAQQSYMYLSLRGRLGDLSWANVAYTEMVSAVIWALLTPLVLTGAVRFPVRNPHRTIRLLGYFVMGGLTTFVHLVVLQRLTLPDTPLSSQVWQLNLVVGFMIFCVVSVIGHRRLFAQWLRARDAAAAVLSTELAAARARAVKLQEIPNVLLHSLDGIAETVRRDPSLTERQLTRLADYLRLALETTDARGLTAERERTIASAAAALRDSGAYPTNLPLPA